jgi:hypothetical protein
LRSRISDPSPVENIESAHVACHLALQDSETETIHLVLDNLNFHCRKSLTDVIDTELKLFGSGPWLLPVLRQTIRRRRS